MALNYFVFVKSNNDDGDSQSLSATKAASLIKYTMIMSIHRIADSLSMGQSAL